MHLLALLASLLPSALGLALFTLRLLPLPPGASDADLAYRFEVGEACAAATSDRTERLLCAKIPRFESAYRIDVGRCEVRGSAGEVTAWQILPRSRAERERLCRSTAEDAIVAIERIRESRAACARLPTAERLALYARGSCASVEGRRLSRARWVYEAEVRDVAW